jgi:hypothetical protein
MATIVFIGLIGSSNGMESYEDSAEKSILKKATTALGDKSESSLEEMLVTFRQLVGEDGSFSEKIVND